MGVRLVLQTGEIEAEATLDQVNMDVLDGKVRCQVAPTPLALLPYEER